MKILFLATAFATAHLTGSALAEPSQRTSEIAVISIIGLDVGSKAGIRTLDLRILHAASALCGTPSSADARGRIKFIQCRELARASAAPQRNRAIEVAHGRDADVIALNR